MESGIPVTKGAVGRAGGTLQQEAVNKVVMRRTLFSVSRSAKADMCRKRSDMAALKQMWPFSATFRRLGARNSRFETSSVDSSTETGSASLRGLASSVPHKQVAGASVGIHLRCRASGWCRWNVRKTSYLLNCAARPKIWEPCNSSASLFAYLEPAARQAPFWGATTVLQENTTDNAAKINGNLFMSSPVGALLLVPGTRVQSGKEQCGRPDAPLKKGSRNGESCAG